MSEKPFNKLSLEDDELLSLLAEECAETIQIIMKIQRHGLDSCHPDDPSRCNSQLLNKELGHIEAAKTLLARVKVITPSSIEESKQDKLRAVGRWLHHHVPEEGKDDEIPF